MLISELLSLPDRVRQGDFVLKLAEGVSKADETLGNYVVTDQLADCFERALGLIGSAVAENKSKGCYLHGSFGSGKSHFMAVLNLILDGNKDAKAIPELAGAITKNNDKLEGKKFLQVPYHMIGADSMEQAILGGYVKFIEKTHPDAPLPPLYRSADILANADDLRASMGDAAFLSKLNEGRSSDDGWGELAGEAWTAERYEEARAASPNSDLQGELVSSVVANHIPSARQSEDFVDLDTGLSMMSRHASKIGYHGLILFLDELILWLATKAADQQFLATEGPKLSKLVESQDVDRPIPVISFVARQRDLKELVGDSVTGQEHLRFMDSLQWWDARFDQITLKNENLVDIAERRVLNPKDEAARQKIDQAFKETEKIRTEVRDMLLTSDYTPEKFRQIYPFSPAFMETMVEMSFLMQRERTALKVMLQLLIDQRDSLELGQIIPVGDLFDPVAEGAEPVMEQVRVRFEHARNLYLERFKPLLERDHGLTVEEAASRPHDDPAAKALRDDARLIKTLMLASLAPNVEPLRSMDARRLVALNHGTIKSPIKGQEANIALTKCRKWATEVGQLRVGEDPVNPTLSIQLSEVDTDSILEKGKAFDNEGNRVRKIRQLMFHQLKIPDGDDLRVEVDVQWRGTRRRCHLQFGNVRELPLHMLETYGENWTVVIDWPFDKEGFGVRDDEAHLAEFREEFPEGARTLVWLPSFFGESAIRDLGRLVVLENVLKGDNFINHTNHLPAASRDTAKNMLENQRSQLEQRLLHLMAVAYGIQSGADGMDSGNCLEGHEHFQSLDNDLSLRVPAAANLRDALEDILSQGLTVTYPGHPAFEDDASLTLGQLRKVFGVVQEAVKNGGRISVDRAMRKTMRQIANPLQLGEMGEQYFDLGNHWQNHFVRRQQDKDEGGPWTVANMRRWMNQPEKAGLPEAVQDLVILSFAAQTNQSISLINTLIEQPEIGKLQDEMELRKVELPSETDWKAAAARSGHLFGLNPNPLLNAQNVANFSQQVRSICSPESRNALEALVNRLRDLPRTLPSIADDTPRLSTAVVAQGLTTSLSGLEDNALVEAVAAAEESVVDAAVGTAIKQAGALIAALDRADWESLDTIGSLSGEHEGARDGILSALAEAASQDEHVTGLAGALNEAERQAKQLIRKALEAPPASGASGVTAAPVPLPPTPPKPAPGEKVGAWSVGSFDELRTKVDELESEAADFKSCEIEITWRVRERG